MARFMSVIITLSFFFVVSFSSSKPLADVPFTPDYDPSVTKFFKDEIVYRCGNKPFSVAWEFHLNKQNKQAFVMVNGMLTVKGFLKLNLNEKCSTAFEYEFSGDTLNVRPKNGSGSRTEKFTIMFGEEGLERACEGEFLVDREFKIVGDKYHRLNPNHGGENDIQNCEIIKD